LAFTGNNLTVNQAVTAPGGMTVANAGVFTTAAAGDITAAGGFNQTGAGLSNLAGDITTTNTNIGFAGPITLAGPVAMSTGAGAGNITFTGTVDGFNDLTLNAGTGDINIEGEIGGIAPLRIFVGIAENINFFDNNITAESVGMQATENILGTGVITTPILIMTAGGFIGTFEEAVGVNTGSLTIAVLGEGEKRTSANFAGNITEAPRTVNIINNPPGLVFFNGTIVGGAGFSEAAAGSINSVLSSILDATTFISEDLFETPQIWGEEEER